MMPRTAYLPSSPHYDDEHIMRIRGSRKEVRKHRDALHEQKGLKPYSL